eukprot:CAMPEP_0197529150 /NCGR_PEP_ID=MMETSP1318-20131121/27460_1 /TAXON_ID=552666 /ORGANISM="Partenskyella glossopodia, Strain RCC365" /LENGTH=221 /DNA_ID=CAMNT_0043084513 /DNA_START=11 /DNA_END=676 /DNA_ORIENTATION=-
MGKFDGIAGMAFQALSVDHLLPIWYPFVEGADEKVFSFYMGSVKNNTNNTQSELLIGGTDPKHHTGPFQYVPLNSATYWQFTLDNISLQREDDDGFVENGTWKEGMMSMNAIADTGTSMLIGPQAVVESINRQLGAVNVDGQHWVFNCTDMPKLPNVVFHFGGNAYPISPKEYIFETQGHCLSGFNALPGLDLFILGDIFLRRYYSVYDAGNKRLGFAVAN